MIRIWMLALLLLAPTATLAQTVVGRAIVDGRPVTLLDNKTWAFAGDTKPGCAELSPKLSFCGDPDRWVPSTKPNPDVIAAYRHDSLHYGQMIVEDIGTDQGLTMQAVRQFILEFAAASSGGVPPIVISTEPATVGSLSGETIVYGFNVAGIDTVYANTILLGDTTLVQLITYQLGDEYTDKHAELHAEFIAASKVSE
jgi:hypothetical protein